MQFQILNGAGTVAVFSARKRSSRPAPPTASQKGRAAAGLTWRPDSGSTFPHLLPIVVIGAVVQIVVPREDEDRNRTLLEDGAGL